MAAYSSTIREEEIKNKLRNDFFKDYDSTPILGNIDFAVAVPTKDPELFEADFLLWAESKKGTREDIYSSLVQLILTIGKEKTYSKYLPPVFLGAFDAEKIAFLPCWKVIDIFYKNDFNWNVAPSDHTTKEFHELYNLTCEILKSETLIFSFEKDEDELRRFLKRNFKAGSTNISKTPVTKNNFITVFNRWAEKVKPNIAIKWDILKQSGIYDRDFFLADLMSRNEMTIREKLQVLLRNDHYIYGRGTDPTGALFSLSVPFKDNGEAHRTFWLRYKRPPRKEYQEYILNRQDLLVENNVRERKGSFFTPKQWVELSQQYLADTLGENWQDEYYIWDCAAGTGNLLAGLTNKYNIYASTLDKADVDVMYERIKSGANLLESHVFQFDFLNDPFTKLPHGLQDIINDPAKREKLVIYINPPYAEVSSKKTTKEGRKGKTGVNKSIVHNRYHELLGTASREVFCLFLARIYAEIPSTTLAIFSKLKILQGSAFFGFLQYFRADLKSLFVVPADTFDNVKGKFPIGFFIWDTSKNDPFISIKADVYDSRSNMIGMKTFERYDRATYINRWISLYKNDGVNAIGYMDGINGNDFQHNNIVYILNSKTQIKNPRGIWINQNNLIPCCVYLAVRKCIESTWLNDRDQFLIPDSSWIEDTEFQYDCLAYTLFNNNIQSSEGTNHWIPFTEQEIGAKDCFKSRFMSNFIKGALADNQEILLFSETDKSQTAISFSKEAEEVMKAGKEIYKYYHSQESSIPDASFYDIKLFFQGRNNKGVMNQDSSDSEYMKLLNILKTSTKQLAQKIALSVYKYGFLKQ